MNLKHFSTLLPNFCHSVQYPLEGCNKHENGECITTIRVAPISKVLIPPGYREQMRLAASERVGKRRLILVKLKLLYVDDEKINLTNFEIAFKRHYQIFTANSGQEALEVLNEVEDIGIVVADQRMPGMTGVQLLEEVKAQNSDAVRIILTAYTEVSDIIDAINKGQIYHYIVKPWVENELLQLLEKASEKYLLVSENRRLVKELEEDISKRKQLESILVRRDMALAEVTDMAVKLLLHSDWHGYAEELIARIGIVMAVSRVHIFQHQMDEHQELWARRKFEWIGEHVLPGFCEPAFDDFCYRESELQRWLSSFESGIKVYGNIVDFPFLEARWLRRFHIKSLVSAPIMTGEKCWGFICFEDCSSEREWVRPELDSLKTCAILLGTSIVRKKMEGVVSNHRAQLAHAGRLTALGEMASGIGHEIHQPLSVINLSAENCQSYLADHNLGSPALEAVGEIREQVVKIKKLIDNMRRFSRLSSGEMESLHLTGPLENALTFYREQFRLNGIELDVAIEEDLPKVTTDGQKFEQILVNFLSNARHAVEARKEGGDYRKRVAITMDCQIKTAEELADLTGKREGDRSLQLLRVEVEDNGVGMDDITKQRCLEPFYTTKPVGDGTGLGLSVSYNLIKELQCYLEIDSREGEGSVFRLYIPIEREVQV